eukprot:836196-Pleurochrysis_carterae.AAC.1
MRTAYDDVSLLQAESDDAKAAWCRARMLCTLGVLASLDGSQIVAANLAHFLAGGGRHASAAGAVATSVAVATGTI